MAKSFANLGELGTLVRITRPALGQVFCKVGWTVRRKLWTLSSFHFLVDLGERDALKRYFPSEDFITSHGEAVDVCRPGVFGNHLLVAEDLRSTPPTSVG